MFENSQQLQLAILSLLITLLTIGCFTYILWKQPPALHMTRDGVPFFTPAVIHPDTGESIPVGTLVRHFKADN